MSTTLLRWSVAAALIAHGIAHAPGFGVSWKLMTSPEIPYHTAIFGGRLDVGDAGMRAIGLLWLLTAAVFVLSGILVVNRQTNAFTLAGIAAVVSLALCVAEWPFARIGLVINIGLLAGLPLFGTLMWRVETREAFEGLARVPARTVSAPHTTLPPPVARYLARAVPRDMPGRRRAFVTQRADFRVNGTWRPLTATQAFTSGPAGFVWDARIWAMPFVPIYVRDAYVEGTGSMTADVLGVRPLVRQSGRPELDAAALHRYLAEAVWFPFALTPAAGVTWTPVDDHTASATLVDGHTRVTAEFRFTADFDVREIFVPDRFMESGGSFTPTPWLVRCSEHALRDGMRIPMYCEVEWQLPTGPLPYWRGRVESVRYE